MAALYYNAHAIRTSLQPRIGYINACGLTENQWNCFTSCADGRLLWERGTGMSPAPCREEVSAVLPWIQHQQGHDELPGRDTAAHLAREEVVDGGDVGYGVHW